MFPVSSRARSRVLLAVLAGPLTLGDPVYRWHHVRRPFRRFMVRLVRRVPDRPLSSPMSLIGGGGAVRLWKSAAVDQLLELAASRAERRDEVPVDPHKRTRSLAL
jgi:hypothetical protein